PDSMNNGDYATIVDFSRNFVATKAHAAAQIVLLLIKYRMLYEGENCINQRRGTRGRENMVVDLRTRLKLLTSVTTAAAFLLSANKLPLSGVVMGAGIFLTLASGS